jgi:hypothetical protein
MISQAALGFEQEEWTPAVQLGPGLGGSARYPAHIEQLKSPTAATPFQNGGDCLEQERCSIFFVRRTRC